jgi:hypothetical protein
VKSPVTGTETSHGVRQAAPLDVRATAPGGVEFIVRSRVVVPESAFSIDGTLSVTDVQHDSMAQAASAIAPLIFRPFTDSRPQVWSNAGFFIEADVSSRIRSPRQQLSALESRLYLLRLGLEQKPTDLAGYDLARLLVVKDVAFGEAKTGIDSIDRSKHPRMVHR